MTGHCRDCRWWGEAEMDFEPTRICLLTWGRGTKAVNTESLAFAAEKFLESGAALATKPDFGCVQFEAKP